MLQISDRDGQQNGVIFQVLSYIVAINRTTDESAANNDNLSTKENSLTSIDIIKIKNEHRTYSTPSNGRKMANLERLVEKKAEVVPTSQYPPDIQSKDAKFCLNVPPRSTIRKIKERVRNDWQVQDDSRNFDCFDRNNIRGHHFLE